MFSNHTFSEPIKMAERVDRHVILLFSEKYSKFQKNILL
jgi:hypothetical protein